MSAKRWHLVYSIALLAVLTAPGRASLAALDRDEAAEHLAQSKKRHAPWRTLAQRIPSVTHRAFTKGGRTELFGHLGLSLSDPFFRYLAPGVGVRYHFDETWAVGASIAYDGAIGTAIDLVSKANTIPTPDFNHPNLDVGVHGVWSPFYGKVSWMAEHVSHFDMYLSAGVGFLQLHHGGAIAATVAVGQHYFVTPKVAFTIEIREQLYSMARDPAASANSQLQSLLMASVGVSFFVPDTYAFAQP